MIRLPPRSTRTDTLFPYTTLFRSDFAAFTGRRRAEHVTCRLVVRRVKRLQPLASDGTEQGELFATYRHHGFITNSTLSTVEADERHRDHAVIEQVIAERSEERRVGKGGVSTCRSRWSPCHKKKKK